MHLVNILVVMFGWPAGIVLGNLLASFLWVPLQWLGIHLRLKSHNDALHVKLDNVLDRLEHLETRRPEPELLTHDDPS